ncbi:MAG: branched-chain amino acid ABC transporter substrate-binding protein [Betaproteobacteria bacterium]|jgi:branched-chain amino acid transport system substrate-binding protein|nr:branched-chain amino acid ABC transporter substrate-binding protein [Betaproteobacteria bacterium]
MYAHLKAFSLAAVLTLALVGCGKEEQAPAPKAAAPAGPPEMLVKIGNVAPTTGPIAHLGKDNENGAKMAVDDVNAMKVMIDGKVLKLELVPEDDQADPKQGTIVAQKLVDAKVAAVVGHLNSGTTIPASKIYSDAGIPQISPSATNPKYTEQGFKTAFRVVANDIQQGGTVGTYIAKDMGAKKVAIIDDRTAYGQGVADEVEKAAKAAGAQVVAREFTNDKATDFKAILTKIKGKNPDAIFYGGMDATGGPMAKQAKDLGINSKFVMADGGCSPEFIKLAGDAAEGFICSIPGAPVDKLAKGEEFKKRYKEKFGTDVQIYSPNAYDAVMVIVEAMKKANSADPAKFLPEISKVSYDGITGKITFDEKGDLNSGAITMYEAKDGKLEAVTTLGGK